MNNNGQNFYRTAMIVFITVIVTLLLSTVGIYNFVKINPGTKYVFLESNNGGDIEKSIKSIRGILDAYYLGDIPEDNDMNEGAIKGYVEALDDEYTEYMTSSEWQNYKEKQLGNYTGFGVYLSGVDEGQLIVSIIEGSPAERAELEVGDIIIKVDDMVCNKDNGAEVTNYIKSSPSGKMFNVDILRNGEKISKEIQTEMIRAVKVHSEMLENNIGYLYIATFDLGCASDFKEKCQELVENGAKGIIIDLRNNTGGVFTEALSISEMLLDKDAIMSITRDKNNNKVIYKSKTAKEVDLPVVVLVNNYSASASEVMVAALKDNNRATILGTKTFGKGILQDVLSLSNGASLKITTQEFLTPNGDAIHKVGIEPDIKLDIPLEYSNIAYVPEGEDNQLQKAIELLK